MLKRCELVVLIGVVLMVVTSVLLRFYNIVRYGTRAYIVAVGAVEKAALTGLGFRITVVGCPKGMNGR
jgi:hypothetical protein